MKKIVGIDLGTTNSLVAYVGQGGKPEVVGAIVPSVVTFTDSGPVVGAEAKKNKLLKPEQTVYSVKRLLGRGLEDLKSVEGSLPYRIVAGDGGARVEVAGRAYTAIEISAMILRELKRAASEALGEAITQAVITVPAYFNDSQRQATRAAGRLAGLDVLRIVNEPTAAALAYGLDRKKNGLIAVYDLGGGTFDISILKLHDGVFEVLATNGDTALGGDDLDRALAQAAGLPADSDLATRARYIEGAEALKIAFSEHDRAKFSASQIRPEWTRAEFEALAKPILDRTRGPCAAALKDAGLSAKDLTDVILVGGPTRLGVVRETAREIFGREPNTSVHPDEVVALGAAIQADILSGRNRDLLLLDVAPLSLGIETYGGAMAPLIARNTRIPAAARELFTTFVDNQTGVDIHVLQGERERAEDNRSLAKFKLRIPPAVAGFARVEVTFLIDADGILQVAARDQRTGEERAVEVKPSFGLSAAEIDRMIADSAEHAGEDVAYRKLVEARTEAEPVLRGSEKHLTEAKRLLPAEDVARIEQRMEGLRRALAGSDPDAIRENSQALGEVTGPLADLVVKEALQGGRGA